MAKNDRLEKIKSLINEYEISTQEELTDMLINAGYNADEVQNKVNELYKLSKELEPYKKKAGEYWECVLKF